MRPPDRRIGPWVAAALLLLLGGGCWEVIPYEPDESRPTTAPEHGGEIIGASDETSFSPPGNRQPGDVAPGSGLRSDLDEPDRVISVRVAEKAADDGAVGDQDAGQETAAKDLPEPAPADSHTRRLAWKLGSGWSLGTAYFARGVSADRYRPILDEAAAAAHGLGVEVPPLPDLAATNPKVPSVVVYLVKDQGHELADRLGRQFDRAHAGLFELATGSHLLLLIYSPHHKRIQLQLDQVEQSAHVSGLPESIWGPLVELLRMRAPYRQVKEAVFRLHQRADAHLAQL